MLCSAQIDTAVYRRRRENVLRQIGEDGIAIVFAAPEQRRSGDTDYPFRQDSYFYYLTGFTEPQAALVLDGKNQTAALYCRDKDESQEIWHGFRYGAAAAKTVFGMEHAGSISQWQTAFQEALAGHSRLYALWGLYPEHDQTLLRIWHQIQQTAGQRAAAQGVLAPDGLMDLSKILNRMRLIKDEHEQELMRKAGKISAAAHVRAMRYVRSGCREYQVEAEILHEFMQQGARYSSYNSIIAGGKNACCLHYVDNHSPLADGDLLLIDAGAEYQMYAGDITRTFPVSGKFSGAQKEVYEIVLASNIAAIEAIRPGADWQVISQAAIAQLTQGLLDLGLLSGSLNSNIETSAYRRFYMHGLGHWLGMDVHDVGGRFNDNGTPILLQSGMCTTVEPGLYIAAADDIPAHFHNIGVRIEDNVLITDNGCEVYTADAPKTVAAIEALMAE
ncbi:aminopeptidase P N-terminal domain-containing protein [Stenoxybacter acetivorans]|uniref:aminopeptidase P N-terminal domain-containing protein n=1 Tax=Stenoxybacter acetivorans TaxID=422441 RepID=UPI00068A353C|nr:aminopeptidase P N-terminal domain-containing protein [Stenoxybacter acetivorans]